MPIPHTHPPTHVTRLGKDELLGPSLSQMCPLFVLSCPICLSPSPLSWQLCRGMNLGEESLHSPALALPAPQEGWLQLPTLSLVSSQATRVKSFILKSFL